MPPSATGIDLVQEVKSKAKEGHAHVVSIRRDLHRVPELAFEEHQTAARIDAELSALGVDQIRTGVAKTGIIAEIHGSEPGPVVVLRADIDALPIQEQNTFDFRSTIDGKMHACGHDGHTAALLGAARILCSSRQRFAGTARLLFQPSEEKLPGGAPGMIEAGALDGNATGPPIGVFGQHVRPSMPAGMLGVLPGPFMASADEIYITIKGDGGHAAEPHLQNCDPVVVASQVVLALQSVISRSRPPGEPGILTIGRLIADGATNVIPGEVVMEGTLRTMNNRWRKQAHDEIHRVVSHVASGAGAESHVHIKVGYPPLVNDPDSAELVRETAMAYNGPNRVQDIEQWYAAEDFACYLEELPGAFFMLGVGNETRGYTSAVHTPTFTIDEDALQTGAGFMAYLAITALARAQARG